MRPRPRRALAAVVVALLVLAGCADRQPAARPADPAAGADDLRYGATPAPEPGVTLQPDVVLVGGGGRSVRSVTADGLTWRLDRRARNADALAPGKVMFVTGRGVGRVLDVAPDGDDLLVTIGPVDITEVVRDGTFARSGVALADPIVYPAGAASWADAAPPPPSTYGRSAPLRRPAARAPAEQPVQPPPQRGGDAAATVHGYHVYSTCCTDGVGVHFTYDDGNVRLVGTVTLTFSRPDATFHLAIGGGAVTRAELEIGGGFGIKVDFEGGIRDGRNHSRSFPVPVDITFPIGQILGIPLSFTIGQTLSVTTAFGAKLGTVKGSGEFALAGSLGFGYADGVAGPRITKRVQRRSSLLNSLTGVPVGVMGLVIRHGVRFTVGISAFLFTAGVYFELVTSYGSTLGSALGAPYAQCRGVGIGVRAAFGVGYRILEPVVRVLNKFLSLLTPHRATAIGPIPAQAGPRWSTTVHDAEEVVPDVAVCGRPPR
ncbi:hypothetical protein [Micromonospora sp. NPDC002575]|uniref:hypothetical protein n=1 Tax=Micromonospora sp. NPDC002575 TaxID=3364222 RepID=UPI0036A20572